MCTHFRPSDLGVGQSVIQDALNKLPDWSLGCNLALNPKKTKVMILSSTQTSRAHGLETCSLNLTVNGKRLERVSDFRLLGTQDYLSAQCWIKKLDSYPIKLINLYLVYGILVTLILTQWIVWVLGMGAFLAYSLINIKFTMHVSWHFVKCDFWRLLLLCLKLDEMIGGSHLIRGRNPKSDLLK